MLDSVREAVSIPVETDSMSCHVVILEAYISVDMDDNSATSLPMPLIGRQVMRYPNILCRGVIRLSNMVTLPGQSKLCQTQRTGEALIIGKIKGGTQVKLFE